MSKGLATAATIAALSAALLTGWLLGPWSPLPPANPPGTRIEWAVPATAPPPTERIDAGARETAAEAGTGEFQATARSIRLRAWLDGARPAVAARVDVGTPQANDGWPANAPFGDEPMPPTQASFTTDANGEVRLPWRHDQIGVVPITAQHGFAFGTTTISTTATAGSTHDVQLATDQTLQVRVVDAHDRPAPSVWVGVRATTRHADGRDHADTMLARARTGTDGGATFAHVQGWLGKIAPRPARTFEVYAWLPGGDVDATIDAAALPREPVVLKIPPAGSIEIAAREVDGTPLLDEMIVLAGTDSSVLVPAKAPLTTVAHVPPARKWQVWIPGCDRVAFDGPRTASETVRVELQAPPRPIVIARLVRDGSPLANTPMSSFDGLMTIWLTPATDADGRVRLSPISSNEAIQTIHFDVKDEQGVTWRARWRGDLDLTPATHDLGDLHLERVDRQPLMASGRVVAPRGLDSVQVSVICPQGRRAAAVEHHATLRPDGTFTIRGTDPGGELAITIASSSHLLAPAIPFAFGQQHLVVTLLAGVRLVASIPVASRELAQCLRIGLQAIPGQHDDDDEYIEAPDQRTLIGNTVECAWDAREPGRYRLTIRYHEGPGEPAASVDVNLPAGAGEVRLPPIVLPEARLVRLHLPPPLRSDRETEWPASVKRIVGNDTHETGVEERGQWCFATTGPVDLRVHVPGHRALVLRGVFNDTTVALEPAIPIDLIVDAQGVPDGATVRATLCSDDAVIEAQVIDGRALFALPDPGEYSLSVRVGPGWADPGDWHCEPDDTLVVPEHAITFRRRAVPPRK